MDITVPGGMGGKETIREILKIDPDVKAIVTSGYAKDPIMSDYKKFGFIGVVPKPYRVEEISGELHRILAD
jgi:DNA-binding NarL/FixJ family response regulator